MSTEYAYRRPNGTVNYLDGMGNPLTYASASRIAKRHGYTLLCREPGPWWVVSIRD